VGINLIGRFVRGR